MFDPFVNSGADVVTKSLCACNLIITMFWTSCILNLFYKIKGSFLKVSITICENIIVFGKPTIKSFKLNILCNKWSTHEAYLNIGPRWHLKVLKWMEWLRHHVVWWVQDDPGIPGKEDDLSHTVQKSLLVETRCTRCTYSEIYLICPRDTEKCNVEIE